MMSYLPGLACLLDTPVLFYLRTKDYNHCKGVIAWGRKPSSVKAQAFAIQHQLPLIRIEDGFLRSIGLGNQEPPLSVVVDDLGIFYDANVASRLETLIATELTPAQRERARALINSWRMNRVSKYNYAREFVGELPQNYVFVTDQSFGDASVKYGRASASHFEVMLTAALKENQDCKILIKIHPDVICGKRKGYFDINKIQNNPRIVLMSEDVHPVSLIERAQAVYCVTSQIGFEALLWGKRVRTFGMPFYAGWGLTQDEQSPPERRRPVDFESLVYAALIAYPRYLNPDTNKRCEIEELLDWMGLQRRMREQFPSHVYARGFAIHKTPIIRRFFQGSRVHFVHRLCQIPNGATLLVWGNEKINLPPSRQDLKLNILRLEDGFLRSVGLGVDLINPVSWVIDSRGIYYDATCVSDLEFLLNNSEFSADLIKRAQRLRERIVAQGLTKYNVGTSIEKNALSGINKAKLVNRKVILVPGQVETDASITFGAPNIRHNMALLQAVRVAEPDAYLIYKPHPDSVSGIRSKGKDENQAESWCNELITDIAMGELLPHIDEAHVLTSLAGFEALLRGKHVTCYGQPFYAGWGLTTDMEPISRRSRRLSLDELVTATLILYPTYVSRINKRYITPEQALDELIAWRTTSLNGLPKWCKRLRPLRRALRPFLNAMGIR